MTQIQCPREIPAGRWRKVWADAKARIEDPGEVHAALLKALVLNLMQAEQSLIKASKKPLVYGSQDQEVANPLFAVSARCEATAIALVKQLELPMRSDANQGQGKAKRKGKQAQQATLEDELASLREKKRAAP